MSERLKFTNISTLILGANNYTFVIVQDSLPMSGIMCFCHESGLNKTKLCNSESTNTKYLQFQVLAIRPEFGFYVKVRQ